MNMIGIIGAMEEEVAIFKEEMQIKETKRAIDIEYIIGELAGKGIVLARAGVGKVNAAICAQAMIDLMGVDCIISVGVAGGIGEGLRVGDVVVAADLIYHDMDASSFGYAPGIVPRMAESTFATSEQLTRAALAAAEDVMKSADNKAMIGRMATGDQFISSDDDRKRIAKGFSAHCVEMESAAIAHACYLNGIPFAAIRAISDAADDDAGMTFDKFMPIAAERSARIVVGMLGRL